MLMNKKSKIFFIVTFIMISMSAIADSFPRGCEAVGFNFTENFLILNEEGKQTFYLIQNQSQNHIELKRFETEDVFMSPTLETRLGPSRWAAFASDVQNIHFECYTQNDNANEKVDCRDVLDICQYPRVKFALSNMGNYWVSTNKTQKRVIKDAIAKGILLRW